MHYLYRIINRLNNKVYIGQSIIPEKRWKQHQAYSKQEKTPQYIHRAMAKYGIDNFTFEIIATCFSQEDADETEIVLITQYDSRNKEKGYNLGAGGNTNIPGEETRKKMSISAKQRIIDYPNTNPSVLDNPPQSEEQRKAHSIFMTGRKASEETKIKLSEALKQSYELGERTSYFRDHEPWNKGIPMREETKRKLSQSLIGNIPGNKINFTEEQISIIINDPRTCKEIAQDYNVSHATIWKMKKEAGTNKSITESKKVKRSLTEDQAKYIREEYAADPKRGKQTELAKKYGVRQQLINKLLNGKSYNQ